VLTWVGFAVVVLVMTAFLLLQHKKKQHNARDANHNVLSVVVTSSSEGNGSVTAVNIAPAAAAASVTSISESLNDGISSASSSNKLLKATAGKSSHGTDIV
jgi:hypothetical protein